jgi:hypothetical protein
VAEIRTQRDFGSQLSKTKLPKGRQGSEMSAQAGGDPRAAAQPYPPHCWILSFLKRSQKSQFYKMFLNFQVLATNLKHLNTSKGRKWLWAVC